MTHQHLLQGVPAPKRTLVHSSVLNFVCVMIDLMLFRFLPLPAIKEPVYASCNEECSNIAKRIPAVHCVKALMLLKCKRYLFFPAVEILRTFWRGWASLDRVSSVSIYIIVSPGIPLFVAKTDHFYRGVCQVHERRRHFPLVTSSI